MWEYQPREIRQPGKYRGRPRRQQESDRPELLSYLQTIGLRWKLVASRVGLGCNWSIIVRGGRDLRQVVLASSMRKKRMMKPPAFQIADQYMTHSHP